MSHVLLVLPLLIPLTTAGVSLLAWRRIALQRALAVAGASLADVAKTTVYVATADRADLTAAWEVVRAAFGDHDAPSTLLSVPVLGWPGQLVEVEAVAVVPSAPTSP